MEGTSEWIVRVNEQAEQVRFSDTDDTTIKLNKCSIYRLPARMVNLNKEAYYPQWVSLGPFHHGEEHLKPMEEHKNQALLYTLKRSKKNLKCFVHAVEEIADDLLDSYQYIDLDWKQKRGDFVRLMIVDGCFMLEILRKESSIYSNDYPPSDPVFGKHGDHRVLPYIKCDMMLLENQLPFLLLQKLASVQEEGVMFVRKLINSQFFPTRWITEPMMEGCLHMVDLCKRVLVSQPSSSRDNSSQDVGYYYVGSAKGNNQAGITFKSSKTENFNALSFSNGILKLPFLRINEASEPVFLNLLAFERFHVGAGSEITSYVYFMSSLIKDVSDVRLLGSKNIILNEMGNEATTVQLFKLLSKDIAFDPNTYLYKEVTSKMIIYRNNGWPKFRSSLIDTYIREWPVLSAAAAALLFILTIIQTFYSVYSAYHKT